MPPISSVQYPGNINYLMSVYHVRSLGPDRLPKSCKEDNAAYCELNVSSVFPVKAPT